MVSAFFLNLSPLLDPMKLTPMLRRWSWVALLAFTPAGGAAVPVDFAQEVLPLLRAKCFDCHGSDKNSKADLRLDSRQRAFAGGESGPSLIPGRPQDSLLFQRVTATDEDELMPPPGKGEKLTAAEVEVLRRWIEEGASWPDEHAGETHDKAQHWAFRPPVRPPVPKLESENGQPVNPVDAFIGARLRQEGLTFSPPAPRGTLLRRLHFDITGLPPSQRELDAFLTDSSPDAIECKIDELLASPHYGERWARHWLDAARYADSQGYEKDPPRYSVWFWRDWVINALNDDMPYDQFIIEQIAGDLLPNATQSQIVATGFLRQSMLNEEGGVDPEQFRMEAMFDRMDCIGKSILGLTIQCAQCHAHKFDPISQEEYYQMFAFLNNDDEPQRVVYTPEELQQVGTLRSQIAEIEAGLKELKPDWAEAMAAWEAEVKAHPEPDWTTLTGEFEANSTGGQKYLLQPDGSYLAQGYAPTKHSAYLIAKPQGLKKITAFRLELLNDPNLPCSGPGRSIKGTCALTEFTVRIAAENRPEQKVTFARVVADFSDPPDSVLEPTFDDRSNRRRVTGPASYAIDGNHDTAWGIDAGPGRRNQPRVAIFYPAEPIELPEGAIVYVTLVQNHGGWNSDDLMTNNLGRFRISITDAETVPEPAFSPTVAAALAVPPEQRSKAQVGTIFSHWRTTVPEFSEANARIEALWRQWPEGATALTLQPRPGGRPTMVLRRGDWLQPSKPVTAGVPAVLHPLPSGAPPTRLTFARWLAAKESPTTARAYVNRVWQIIFGHGLVPSVEDLGVQSEPPSHPELLDWLAVEFMEQGWSQKKLLRLLFTSRTYQQQSMLTPELAEKDPANRLLARAPRLRVEAETVKDMALTVSSLLNPKIGGPSIMAPAPLDLFRPPASYAPFPWVNAEGPDKYRRALYTFRRRSTPYPVLQIFDAPNGEASCVRRARSNTPMQALTLLNEDFFIEAARALGRRLLTEAGATTASWVRWGFREVYCREPEPEEVDQLVVFIARQRHRIAAGQLNPNEIATGKSEEVKDLPPGRTAADLALATALARVLLTTDEAITKE